jgi:hypothetical protein
VSQEPTAMTSTPQSHRVLDGLDEIVGPLEHLYRDLHAHPELSNQGQRTAAKAAEQQLERAGYEVSTGVGGTGVVGPGLYQRAEKAGRIAQDVPTNHSPKFAPVLHPTLETGIQALTTASLSYLGR